MSWFTKWGSGRWRGHVGAALPRGSESFSRSPFHHVRTQWEVASPHQMPSLLAPRSGLVGLLKCENPCLLYEPPHSRELCYNSRKRWRPRLFLSPLFCTLADTELLLPQARLTAMPLSASVQSQPSPVCLRLKWGVFSHHHTGSLNLLKTPQRGFPSIQKSLSEWDRRTDPFHTLQAIPTYAQVWKPLL